MHFYHFFSLDLRHIFCFYTLINNEFTQFLLFWGILTGGSPWTSKDSVDG